MDILPFADEHLPGVVRLARGEGWPSFPADPDRARRALTAPGVTTLVALVDGEVVGFAQLQSDGEIQAHLSNVAVDPAHRRKGIGRALVAEAHSRAGGGERVDLLSSEVGEVFYGSFPHRRMPGYRLYPELTDEDLAGLPPGTLLDANDLAVALEVCERTIGPHLGADWSVRAGELEWSCLRTLDHVTDALVLYAAHLASRATSRLEPLRDGGPQTDPREVMGSVRTAAALLEEVVTSTPPGVRAFHPAGMADRTGFVAMGCDEILVHTADVAGGLGVRPDPPRGLCRQVLGRLFPWAPTDVDPWEGLLWANGRLELPGHGRLGSDWYWHPAPLDEWDGTVVKRTSPPAWT